MTIFLHVLVYFTKSLTYENENYTHKGFSDCTLWITPDCAPLNTRIFLRFVGKKNNQTTSFPWKGRVKLYDNLAFQ